MPGPVHSRMPNDIKLGEQVEEIDLVLGGHDHNFDACATVGQYFRDGTSTKCSTGQCRGRWHGGGAAAMV